MTNHTTSPAPALVARACDCHARACAWVSAGGDPFYAPDVERRMHTNHEES